MSDEEEVISDTENDVVDGASQMDEEENDDLVGDNSPEPSQRDEEEEYEVPEEDEEQQQDDNESMDGGEEVPDPPEEEEEEEEEDDETKGHVLSNRVAYYVPKSDGTKPGRVRDHNHPIEVADGQELTALQHAKNWPPVDKIHPMSIVVVKGRFNESDTVSKQKNVGPFVWYVRVVIKGKPNGPDRKLLRLMPKSVVLDFVNHIGGLSEMRSSSLINSYQPENDNAKSFPVQINGWEANKDIKTEAIPQPRAPKKTVETDAAADDDDTSEKKKKPAVAASSSSKPKPNKDGKKPEPKKAESPAPEPKKAESPAPEPKKADPPAPEPKKPKPTVEKKEKPAAVPQSKKSSMLAFAKPKSTPVDTADSVPAEEPSQAATMITSPAPATAQQPSSSSSTQKRSAESADVKDEEYKFKRIRSVEVATESKTIIFWEGNKLYIAERY